MSLSQTASLQSKRQQFHAEIRRKQLDDYRRRKREQFFGTNSTKPKVNFQQKMLMRLFPDEFKQKVTESPYPFNQEFRQFFIKDFQQKLQYSNFSLDSINQVLNHLVVMALNNLSNFDSYHEDMLFSVMRLLSKMMEKVCEIPYNSIVRQNNRLTIEQIYDKVFYSVKTIIKGMISEQDHQENLKFRRQQLKRIEERMRKKEFIPNQRKINQQQFQQNLNKLQQNCPPLKHPIECCNEQIRNLLENFFSIYLHSESIRKNYPNKQMQQQSARHLSYYSMLWYMVSHLRSGLFTASLFGFLHEQLNNINESNPQMAETLIETFSNFLLNETDDNQLKMGKEGDDIIRYDADLIVKTLNILDYFLSDYDLSSPYLISIVKSLSNCILRRKILIYPIMNLRIFTSLIDAVYSSHEQLIELSKQHTKNKISHHQFIQQAQNIHLHWMEKFEIYQFLGTMLCMIDQKDHELIKKIRQKIPTLMVIIFHEMRKIVMSEINNKALQQAVELETEDERQKVVLAVLFLLLNLFSLSPEFIQIFIEQNLLRYITGLWHYFNRLENSLLALNSGYDNLSKLKEIKQVKYAIISIIWNIVIQFSQYHEGNSEEFLQNQIVDASDVLTILTEFKDCAFVKLLLQFLRTTVYNTESVNIDKDSVKFAMFSLERIFNFIIWSSRQEFLCQKLQHPTLNVTTMKQVLSNIMERDEVYEQGITGLALECLNLFDRITENAKYNDDGLNGLDGRYYEQEQMYYSEGNQQNYQQYNQQQDKDVEI